MQLLVQNSLAVNILHKLNFEHHYCRQSWELHFLWSRDDNLHIDQILNIFHRVEIRVHAVINVTMYA